MSNPGVKKLYCICLSEDNEAVIKMILKGRSPTMRHVSRTQRVALDWLFETQELDLHWKSRPEICTANMGLKSEFGL